jgi:transposase
MLVVDGNGLPIGLHVASAQPHESQLADATLKTVRVPRRGPGRPRTRPKELVADKAYDSRRFRQELRHRGIKPTIPQITRRARRPGRPPLCGEGYSERWKVERANAWMDNYRRLLVRHERKLRNYKALCLIAFIVISLNRLLA